MVKQKRNLTDQALGELLGSDKNTIAAYRRGEGLIKGSVLEGLVSKFGFSSVWLLEGEGEPCADLREAPEAGGAGSEPRDLVHIAELPRTYGKEKASGFRISEDLTSAAKILESGTPYATALHLGIQSFYRALEAEKRISRLEASQKVFEQETDSRIQELDKLSEPK